MKYVERVKTPTLVLHGERDDRVRSSQGREFYQALSSLGFPAQLVLYPREPHSFESVNIKSMSSAVSWSGWTGGSRARAYA